MATALYVPNNDGIKHLHLSGGHLSNGIGVYLALSPP